MGEIPQGGQQPLHEASQPEVITNPERLTLADWDKLVHTDPAEALRRGPEVIDEASWPYVEPVLREQAHDSIDFTGLPMYKLLRTRLWYAFGNNGTAPTDAAIQLMNLPSLPAQALLGDVVAGESLPSLEPLRERRQQPPIFDAEGRFAVPL